ncbi:cilia and flagella associated protein 52 [Phyllostomus discolor]|uniref:Cilia and flagella associated protein 52 n=1 Tax=Phyllostomus discolor TaxID=89673 RepID=A0A833ZAL2_9CHIR|nr:cilia and flagella associated protein 52 [Phyllostomus discolor]
MENQIAPNTNTEVAELELEAVIGFNGHVPAGLKCHPDQEHLIYPLGCTVLIQAINTKEQYFLQGHGNNVSCVAISQSGVYIASGQVTFMGFKISFCGIIRKGNSLLGCLFTRAKLKTWPFHRMICTWYH